MRKFVVAILYLGQGELKQYLVEADTQLLAYKQVLDTEIGSDYWRAYVSEHCTTDDIEEAVFDMDRFISALEIST